MEDFNASLTHSYPNYLNYQTKHFEELQESHKSNLKTLMEDYNVILTYPQPNFLYNHHAQYFEESQESRNSNLDKLMEDLIVKLTRSMIETMMTERFVETKCDANTL